MLLLPLLLLAGEMRLRWSMLQLGVQQELI
jgi:hypothetical protein